MLFLADFGKQESIKALSIKDNDIFFFFNLERILISLCAERIICVEWEWGFDILADEDTFICSGIQ